MTQQLVVLCTRHLVDHDEQVLGRSVAVWMDEDPPTSLDLCDQCLKELVTPITAMPYPDMAETPEPKALVPSGACPVCGFTSKNPGGLGAHIGLKTDALHTDYRAAHGL